MIRQVLPPRHRVSFSTLCLLAFLAGCASPVLAQPVMNPGNQHGRSFPEASAQEIRGVPMVIWTLEFNDECQPPWASPAFLCLNGPAPFHDGCNWQCPLAEEYQQ